MTYAVNKMVWTSGVGPSGLKSVWNVQMLIEQWRCKNVNYIKWQAVDVVSHEVGTVAQKEFQSNLDIKLHSFITNLKENQTLEWISTHPVWP